MDCTVEIVASGTSLRFDRRDAGEFREFAVTVRCKAATIVDDSVYFDKPERERFLSEFAAFEQTRRGSATLESSQDFQMQITPDGAAGHAWVSFRLRRHIYCDPGRAGLKSGTIVVESGLPLPGELVAQKLREFNAYFNAHKDA